VPKINWTCPKCKFTALQQTGWDPIQTKRALFCPTCFTKSQKTKKPMMTHNESTLLEGVYVHEPVNQVPEELDRGGKGDHDAGDDDGGAGDEKD